jgi:ribosome maturation protein SDO1
MKYEEEKFSINTAWMKKAGEHFEMVLDPDAALEFKHSKGATPDIRECLKAEHVFSDAKRGLFAKEERLRELFGTDDPLLLAKKFILDGTIQLTAEHRAKIREAKRNQILSKICLYAVDPTTGFPHPRARIQLAIDEAKVRIDDNKDVDEQVSAIVKQLQPILPIKLEVASLQVHVPSQYAKKLYGELTRFGTVKSAEWMVDASLLCTIEMPAGLQTDLMDFLGARTHGAASVKKLGGTAR